MHERLPLDYAGASVNSKFYSNELQELVAQMGPLFEGYGTCKSLTITAPSTTNVSFSPIRFVPRFPRHVLEPPKDAGVGKEEDVGNQGFVKISCEDFPSPAMNLKWASDALDRLIAAANVRTLLVPASHCSLTRSLVGPEKYSRASPAGYTAPGREGAQG